MHRIARVVIHNFRACRDVDLTLAPVTPIVGQNNAGKSTMLDAIQWALAPTKLEPSQFGDPTRAVEVSFEVVGLDAGHLAKLDPRHRTTISSFVSDDSGDLDAAWRVYQTKLWDLGHEALLVDLRKAFKDLERRRLAYPDREHRE